MAETLQERINSALARVTNARVGADVISAEMVRDIATTIAGKVSLTLLLAPNDDAALARDVRQAVERVEGVTDVRVNIKDPSEARGAQGPAPAAAPPPAPRAPGQGRVLPTLDQPRAQQARVPAPTPVA
ncbi:MAG TPA: iron-sulfur cluster assembly protein, partial [Gemmatimonadaceae bacterium]|nr:iron-sulfur cluster assembly protein [Gemmatimonadaceae bacterium]